MAEEPTYTTAIITLDGTLTDIFGLILQIREVAGLMGLSQAAFKKPEPLPENSPYKSAGATHSVEILLEGKEAAVQAILQMMAGQAENREEAVADLETQTKKAREESKDE